MDSFDLVKLILHIFTGAVAIAVFLWVLWHFANLYFEGRDECGHIQTVRKFCLCVTSAILVLSLHYFLG